MLGVALLLLGGLRQVVGRTRTGLAMRALSLNPTAAQLMGVDLDRIIAFTFGLGSALPGAVVGGLLIGVLEALVVGYLSPTYRDPIVFGVLILILLFRPAGLLGRFQPEKV